MSFSQSEDHLTRVRTLTDGFGFLKAAMDPQKKKKKKHSRRRLGRVLSKGLSDISGIGRLDALEYLGQSQSRLSMDDRRALQQQQLQQQQQSTTTPARTDIPSGVDLMATIQELVATCPTTAIYVN
jgi:hypothetical protein